MKADAIDAHDYESLRAGALLYLSALLGLVIARIRAPESRPPDRLSGAMVAGVILLVVVLGVEPLFHPIWLQWLLLSALPLVGMYLLQRALVRRGRLADGSELSPSSRDVLSGAVERPEPPAERPDATPAADPPDATPPADPPPPSTPH